MLSRALLAVIVPTVVFFGGGKLMLIAAGADEARTVTKHGKPLNMRFGYTRDEVVALWDKLSPQDLDVERRLLQVDLMFPWAYGAALAIALLAVWAALGAPFNMIWLLLPVVGGMLADWTENLVQLEQLHRFSIGRAASVDAGWIAVASAATMVKLATLVAAFGLLVALVFWLMLRGRQLA